MVQIPTLFRSQVNMLDSKEASDDEEEEDEARDTPFGKPSFTFWNKEKAFRLKVAWPRPFRTLAPVLACRAASNVSDKLIMLWGWCRGTR